MEYKGKLITHQESDDLYSTDLETGHTFIFILNDDWVIDANVVSFAAKVRGSVPSMRATGAGRRPVPVSPSARRPA